MSVCKALNTVLQVFLMNGINGAIHCKENGTEEGGRNSRRKAFKMEKDNLQCSYLYDSLNFLLLSTLFADDTKLCGAVKLH